MNKFRSDLRRRAVQDPRAGTVTRVSAESFGDLGERLAHADGAEFAECYATLGPPLRRYLRGRLPESDIDDVVQVVLLEVWRFRDRYDPQRSLQAWVFAIA